MYSWIWWLDIYAVHFPSFVYWRVFRTVMYSGFERIYLVMMLLLMDKLFDQAIPLALWSIIDDMYSGLTTRVKWKGESSNTYPVLQGVRQIGILSTHLYNIFDRWIWWLDIYAVHFPAFAYWRVFRIVKYSGFEWIYLVMMLLCISGYNVNRYL
jgi:hypothetical protein